MLLVPLAQPFHNPDRFFEPQWDGFRALAYIDGHVGSCRVAGTSARRGHRSVERRRTQVNVPLRRREVLIARQLLNRVGGRGPDSAFRGQVRTPRNSLAWQS